MKHEWRKKEKNYYIPKAKPEIVNMEKFKFIQIKGSGSPNNEEFSERVGVLYSLAYTIKMMPKKGITPDGYFDYTVYPLEGIWDLDEEGRLKNEFDKKLYFKIFGGVALASAGIAGIYKIRNFFRKS